VLIFDAVQWRLGVLAIMVKASATTSLGTFASALEIGVERSFVVPSDVSHIVAKGRAHTSVKNGLPGDAQLTISIATTKYDSRGPVHC